MAERRMFAKAIIDSDAFLDMPITARLLYYDLAMRADDDGFVNAPKKILRMVGCSVDDMKILAAKKFIIPFESGVVVIKHWRIHNYIRKDTYNETTYKDEKKQLHLDENKAYTLNPDKPVLPDDTTNDDPPTIRPRPVDEPSTPRPRSVDDPWTQVRLGKDNNIYSADLRQKNDEIDRKFDLFWSEYPKKSDKKKAKAKFKSINPDDALFERMMDGLAKWKRSEQWSDIRYVPLPTTWLNGERWEDEVPKSARAVQEDKDLREFKFYDAGI